MPTAIEETVELPKLTNDEIARYSRHLILPEVGMEGQQKLKAAKVLCVGTGEDDKQFEDEPIEIEIATTAAATAAPNQKGQE